MKREPHYKKGLLMKQRGQTYTLDTHSPLGF